MAKVAPIHKAVLPVAGMSTRVPATKAAPKEMLPVVDTPVETCAVEEVQGGRRVARLRNGSQKVVIEDHLDHAYELEFL